jgi:DNA-binding transcriptional regulator YiaG
MDTNMDANEFRAALKMLGISQRQLAADIRADVTAVNRWATGRVSMPGAVEAYLRLRLRVERHQAEDIGV